MSEDTRTSPEPAAPSGQDEVVTPPLPESRDLHRALRIYVTGRSRFWTADEKREAAGEKPPASERDITAIADRDRGAGKQVPVPESLQFHRAVGTWRDDVPGGRRRPSGSRID